MFPPMRAIIFSALISIFAAAIATADQPLVVEVVKAQNVSDDRTFSLTGEIAARDTLSASFPSGGRIAEVLVEEGDTVTEGTVLARMQSVQQEQAVRAAEAGLSTAEADHRQAVEDLERQTALLERGATTRISRDDAEDALRIAEGGLAQARAELDRAHDALDDTVLLAPTDATIIDRSVEPGQVVGAAQPVMTLALGDALDAVFDVPEVLLTTDLPKPEVELTLIDHPDVIFEGIAREMAPLVDPEKGTVAVKVTITDPPRFVAYGDAVRGTATRTVAPFIALPFTSLSANSDGPAVWIVDPETMAVTLRNVEIDRFETGRILLANGVEEGTTVVTKGAQLLYPGRIVTYSEAAQ
ncbi:efflux RND transporter periplasmic adaptor subunit [Algicella marina]|uniref:Efflux RND transporter periplasmic adaptor subunit n=1 Tax=Algicella marina TaxID=2683284 RepID=A0A6P1SUA1_9RHOB|nr:efflux RND transporter periplasmic adaptor subunit [Algicella marina]QHQ34254.1 efflux RND transporter periplasmic adaptor subunit [Algicella marina]